MLTPKARASLQRLGLSGQEGKPLHLGVGGNPTRRAGPRYPCHPPEAGKSAVQFLESIPIPIPIPIPMERKVRLEH
jgi:hypothetical protein